MKKKKSFLFYFAFHSRLNLILMTRDFKFFSASTFMTFSNYLYILRFLENFFS